MSSVKRLISGTQAAWVQIFITFSAQILLVPIFLSNWSSATYGTWLAILAFSFIFKFIDIGHQAFIGFDVLRVGEKSKKEISTIFYSSLPIAFSLGLVQLVLVVGLVSSNEHVSLLGITATGTENLKFSAGVALMLNSTIWLLFGGWSTIVGRVLLPFGYYPRIAWWQVLQAFAIAIFLGVTVTLGGGILEAMIAYNFAYLLVGVPAIVDLSRLVWKSGIKPEMPNIGLGLNNLIKSIAISLKTLMEMIRQQHIRVILAPLIGTVELVVFVTTRTGANILLQGLGTITNPLLPELMRFLKEKEQEHTKSAICFVWFVLIAFLVPGAILAQWLMPYVFSIWTRGQVVYDPMLFALFNLGVLLFALTQPAIAIIQGNNIIHAQILISSVALVVLICGIFSTVSDFGIKGVAVSLLLTDIIVFYSYVKVARDWMFKNDLAWPNKAMIISALSVAIAAIIILAIAMATQYANRLVALGLILTVILVSIFWLEIPRIAHVKILTYAEKWLPEILCKKLLKFVS